MNRLTRLANIGEIGARRRARGGYVWIGVTVIAFAVMVATHQPRAQRLVLAVPLFLAASGIFQARAKT